MSASDIETYINRFARPPADQVAAFVAAGRSQSLAARQAFCDPGRELHELAFIHPGILRYCVTLADGEESTKDFSFANFFAVSFGSADA